MLIRVLCEYALTVQRPQNITNDYNHYRDIYLYEIIK